jgi:hypothetical protein
MGESLHSSGSRYCDRLFFASDMNRKQTYVEPKCGVRKYDYMLQCIRGKFVDSFVAL